MHLNNNDLIINRAERLVKTHGTRDVSSLARALDISIMERNFTTQKGAYIYIARNSPLQEKVNNIRSIYEPDRKQEKKKEQELG